MTRNAMSWTWLERLASHEPSAGSNVPTPRFTARETLLIREACVDKRWRRRRQHSSSSQRARRRRWSAARSAAGRRSEVRGTTGSGAVRVRRPLRRDLDVTCVHSGSWGLAVWWELSWSWSWAGWVSCGDMLGEDDVSEDDVSEGGHSSFLGGVFCVSQDSNGEGTRALS